MQIDDNNIVDETLSAQPTSNEVQGAKQEGSETSGADVDDENLSEEEKAERKSNRVQKRIDEITKARREAERRNAYLEEELAKVRKPAIQIGEKPTLEEFDYDQEAYLDALADYKVKQRLAETANSREENARKEQEQRELVDFRTRESSIRNEYPDYDQVVYSPNTPISETMASAIRKDDNGALVAYFLGKNPDVAYRISQQPPQIQYQAIGGLSDKITEYRQSNGEGSVPSAPQQQQQPNVTAAPAPPPTVTARGTAVKSPEKMTTEEWMEWRNKQTRKR